MIWIVLALSLTVYSTAAYFVGQSILYIRDFDWDRHKRTGLSPKVSSKRVGEDENVAFWLGLFWLPAGLLSVAWHLTQVEWDTEQRQLLRQIRKEQGSEYVVKLRQDLEKEREKRRAKLQAELDEMEKSIT